MRVRPVTATRCSANPIEVKTNVPSAGATILYLPPASVTVPVVVPSTTILTPGKVSPLGSYTVPDTVTDRSCKGDARTLVVEKNISAARTLRPMSQCRGGRSGKDVI